MRDLTHFEGCQRPERRILEGQWCRLEPLTADHQEGLFAVATAPDAEARFRWLFETRPADSEAFGTWFDGAVRSDDPLFFAVIDKRTHRVEGRQTLMRIEPTHGVIEIGNIHWGANIARSPVTTEAFFLFADYVFSTLGYRRFEWKCNNRNGPSKRAAERFGMTFEGVFRQALVVKGENRDTAWYSLLDHEWLALKPAFEAWLSADNFDVDGGQKKTFKQVRGG
ncbi:MAG: GNAT family protein [Pseudomonadota bacterium]